MFLSCSQYPNTEKDQRPAAVYKKGPVEAKMVDAGFLRGDASYHAVTQASNGYVYYVICSHKKNSSARMFRYNPKTERVKTIGILNDIVGEDPQKVFPQGKVHSDLYEHKGKLYFATHTGAYARGGTSERDPYPGGHFLSYDLTTGEFHDYGIPEPEQGIVSMNMDTQRERMYGITWPDLMFVYCDIKTGRLKSFGTSVIAPGVKDLMNVTFGPRSLGLDPRTGNVYWHNMDNTISCYNYEQDSIFVLDQPRLDRPIFRIPNIRNETHVAWRSIRWSSSLNKFFALTYYSEYLFSFEPQSKKLEIIDRIATESNRKSGTIPNRGNLAFELSPDGKTVYYMTEERVDEEEGRPTIKLHLITYNIPLRHYTDHGPVELKDGRNPSYCQSLDVGEDGNLYIVSWIPFTDFSSEKGKKILALHGIDTPEEKDFIGISEVNLIVFDDPIRPLHE